MIPAVDANRIGDLAAVVARRDHYTDFARALAEALDAPADAPIDARYEMHFR